MIIDKLFYSIVREFSKLKENETKATTWTVMNRIYPDCKNNIEKGNNHHRIIERLKTMEGLFEIKKVNGKWIYTLIADNLKFCRHRLSDGMKETLLIRIDSNGKVIKI